MVISNGGVINRINICKRITQNDLNVYNDMELTLYCFN